MKKKGDIGWAVLVFFLPLVGLVLCIVWKDSRPDDAHQAGKGALVGVLVSIVLSAVFYMIFSSMLSSSLDKLML